MAWRNPYGMYDTPAKGVGGPVLMSGDPQPDAVPAA
jgi:hypothetical protein